MADDITSLIFPPTTGINAPDTNLIPFKARLSDEIAKIPWADNSPVYIVENNEMIIITSFINIFVIFIWYSSPEKDEIILNENIMLMIGIIALSVTSEIIFERKTVNELYVTANAGFFDATINPAITGKYVFINIFDDWIPTTASVIVLLNELIKNEAIISIEILSITLLSSVFSFKNDEEIAFIIKTIKMRTKLLNTDSVLSNAKSIINLITLVGVKSNISSNVTSSILRSFRYSFVVLSILSQISSFVSFEYELIDKKKIRTIVNIIFRNFFITQSTLNKR